MSGAVRCRSAEFGKRIYVSSLFSTKTSKRLWIIETVGSIIRSALLLFYRVNVLIPKCTIRTNVFGGKKSLGFIIMFTDFA